MGLVIVAVSVTAIVIVPVPLLPRHACLLSLVVCVSTHLVRVVPRLLLFRAGLRTRRQHPPPLGTHSRRPSHRDFRHTLSMRSEKALSLMPACGVLGRTLLGHHIRPVLLTATTCGQ